MALKPNKSGNYTVKSEGQAQEALVRYQKLQEMIAAAMKENGIDEMVKDADKLKTAATAWAVANDAERIAFDIDKGAAFHATLIRQFHGGMYVGTEDDIPPDYPDAQNATPLQVIIEKNFSGSIKTKGSHARKVWLQVTRRIVDRSLVDQAVSEGVLSVDDVAPAFIEKPKSPYLRIFKDA